MFMEGRNIHEEKLLKPDSYGGKIRYLHLKHNKYLV